MIAVNMIGRSSEISNGHNPFLIILRLPDFLIDN